MNVTSIVVLMSLLLLGQSFARQNPGKHISVYGTAQVDAAADRATVDFTITGSGETLDASLKALDEQMKTVRGPLGKAGIAPEDIATVFLPSKGEETFSDFWSSEKVHRSQKKISVHVTEVDRLPEVLVALENLGITKGVKVTYHLTRLEDLKRVALEEAVSNATEKARVIAENIGVQLGPVHSVEELLGADTPEEPELNALFDSDRNDSTTEITLASRVRVIISIQGN